MGVLQYKDLVLEVDGNQQGLVQNVTVSCDAGLDLITFSSGVLPYSTERKGTISYEQIISSLGDITDAPLFLDKGEIKLYDNVGSGYVSAGQCIISSIEYSLPINGFFVCKYEYTHIGVTGQVAGQSLASYPATGRAPYRVYYSGGAPGDNHQSITINIKANRKNLFYKGDPKPRHSVISFPIETTVTLEMAADSTGFINSINTNFLADKLSEIQGCSASLNNQDMTISMEGSSITIRDLYLSSVNTEQISVDGSPLKFTAEYISYDDYDTIANGQRFINYSSYSSTAGGSGPPPEPE